MLHPAHFTIRTARPEDADALRRLAALDSQSPIDGPVLVGELDGEIAAAVATDGRRAVADPFRPTAQLMAYLRVRAGAARAVAAQPSLRERLLAGVRMPVIRTAER